MEIICECGWKVKGSSEKHCKGNLILHRQSKRHKELMEVKKTFEQIRTDAPGLLNGKFKDADEGEMGKGK